MKAVLLSFRPKWCELIADRKKTIEVRKTRPKLETPFRCYIYCTKPKYKARKNDSCPYFWAPYSGTVIGEFVCDYIEEYFYDTDVGEWAEPNAETYYMTTKQGEQTGMDYPEFAAYGNGKKLFGWHISELKIYDRPKELREFGKRCEDFCCDSCNHVKYQRVNADEFDYDCDCHEIIPLTRPPQSWCYVEEKP